MNRVQEAWCRVLSSEDGLRVIYSIIEMSGFFTATDPSTPSVAWFHGRRSLGAELWGQCIRHDPGTLVQMLQLKVQDDAERRRSDGE